MSKMSNEIQNGPAIGRFLNFRVYTGLETTSVVYHGILPNTVHVPYCNYNYKGLFAVFFAGSKYQCIILILNALSFFV